MGLKDTLLRAFVQVQLNKANERVDFSSTDLDKYPSRSTAILITDLGDNIGFGFDPKQKKLVMFDEIENPTVLVKCTRRVFKAMVAGQIGMNDLFYGNLAEVEGKTLFRDKIILQKAVDAFRAAGMTKF